MRTEDRLKPERELSWKPVLRAGGIYCSTACGGGCTKAAYDSAVKQAAALAKKMGKGWKPFVHENLGWHYRVAKGRPAHGHHCGFLEITPPHISNGEYTAWVQTSPQFIFRNKDPKKALHEAVKAFDEHLRGLNELRATIGTLL